MERLRRVASLWSWLPAFRAVAETQHLPTASAQLRVSASALSRTIRLLESDLGTPLFERQGRRIVLNEAGERLLVAVRDAMRRVHDGMSLMDTTEISGPVQLSSSNLITDAVLAAALARLSGDHPQLIPHVRVSPEGAAVSELLQGQLDVAFTTEPLSDPNLARVKITEMTASVYCAPGHALARGGGHAGEALVEHPFVLWGLRADGSSRDGWPSALPRTVGATVQQPLLAIDIARSGRHLVVLPDHVGSRCAELVRVDTPIVGATPVFAHHRHSLLPSGRAETVVEVARSAVAGGL